MGLGQVMPNDVTKNELMKIIEFLFNQLEWIANEPEILVNAGIKDKMVCRDKARMEPLPEIGDDFQENLSFESCAVKSETIETDQNNQALETLMDMVQESETHVSGIDENYEQKNVAESGDGKEIMETLADDESIDAELNKEDLTKDQELTISCVEREKKESVGNSDTLHITSK